MKKIVLPAFASLCVVLCLLHASCSRPDGSPNVILVSLDTLRADHLKSYGYHRETAPFLDSLVNEGISFKNNIVQANWTLPSHVSIFTSLYPDVHRAQEGTERMSPSLRTMAELLSEAGYATAAFVDGGVLSHRFGFDQGFDLYDDRSKGAEKDRRVVDWLRGHRRKPFFLFYHTYDIHYPYRHHPEPRALGDDPGVKEIARRVRAGDLRFSDAEYEKGIVAWYTDPDFYHMIDPGKLAPLKREMDEFVKERWPKMPSYRESLDYILEAYDGGIGLADARIEKIWDEARGMGLDGNTVLIVTSDHGECFLEHGALGHPPLLYDEILRVPLIIVYPPLERRGLEVEEQVMSIDILPTVLDLVKLPHPPNLQGRSLLPLASGRETTGEFPAYADALDVRAVRAGGWKYIRGGRKKDADRELYELARDPGEARNLAATDPAAREGLEARMRKWEANDAALRKQLGFEGPQEKVTLDSDTLDELRALGYMQ